jgi:GMP synthase-like glutamine amidotransferase
VRVHLLQHASFEGPGLITGWAEAHEVQLDIRHLYSGDTVPPLREVEGLIVMGGPMNADEEASFPFLAEEKALMRALVVARKPVLGICLGAQLLASALGGRVYRQPEPEIGWFSLRRTSAENPPSLLGKLPSNTLGFHWHGDTFELPVGATNWLSSEACQHQLFTCGDTALGVQYHPEVDAEAISAFVAQGISELLAPSAYVQSADTISGYEGETELPSWFEHSLNELFLRQA